jgi:nucleotide-binding universal stress UspA family protein
MSYAAILVHVDEAKETRVRLECAAALAKRFDATLIGVGAEMIPPLVPDYGLYTFQGQWYEVMTKAINDKLERARAAFDTASAGLTKKTIWECGIGMPTPAVASASRGADLIVAGAAPGWRESPYRDASIGELVIASGRPVLAAASKGRKLTGERVLLAWKDTREARRAMADAMPFFERAKEVIVLEVCAKQDGPRAVLRTADVANALKRHGVTASAKVVHGAGDGRQILRNADACGADLIVAGAYGHSRLGEWVFGGVTYDLLSQHTHHVLLSH